MSIQRVNGEATPYERAEARLYMIGGTLAATWFIGGMIHLCGVGRFW